VKGKSIGYRGIGFKSVVGFSKEVHIISGDLEVTFSREKTKIEIPQSTRVPLIRIPHYLSIEDKNLYQSTFDDLILNGYSTIFLFTGVTENEIELEFESLDSTSLLFLRNILETEFCTSKTIKTVIQKKEISNAEVRLIIQSNSGNSEWLLLKDIESTIAFAINDNKIQKLEESNSLVYAFLPTEDNCGLGVLFNGGFSTDPSRRHLIFNDETLDAIKSCSNQILKIIESKLKSKNSLNIEIVNSLLPFSDPRMLQFKKTSFEKYLLENLKNNSSFFYKELKISPSWLNDKDYNGLTEYRGDNVIEAGYLALDGFKSFVKYLGATEDTFTTLQKNFNNVKVTTLGCAQFTIQIVKSIISSNGDFVESNLDLKIFKSDNKRVSFNDIKNEDVRVDESFLTLLIENGLTEFDIKSVFKKYVSKDYSETLFKNNQPKSFELKSESNPKSVLDWLNNSQQNTNNPIMEGLKRWRCAEEQTLDVLNLNGFKLIDVSKQNIGYDLEGFDPNGKEIQIEVKSVNLPGQKFKLTNNEIAVAQEKQNSFFIAIVRQADTFFEIALISDPVNNLVLNRQCVQWIWECSEYEYKPIKFRI
ncbi:MAG: DUF3883 domain-containing protein, partial [Lutibacter sp.]|nr:DUF3883 domain-containing protein [Lutibacter sp.]